MNVPRSVLVFLSIASVACARSTMIRHSPELSVLRSRWVGIATTSCHYCAIPCPCAPLPRESVPQIEGIDDIRCSWTAARPPGWTGASTKRPRSSLPSVGPVRPRSWRIPLLVVGPLPIPWVRYSGTVTAVIEHIGGDHAAPCERG